MKVIEDSFLVKQVNYIFKVLSRFFSRSRIINFFVTGNKLNLINYLNDSLFYSFFVWVMSIIKVLLCKFKVDIYLRNSIFTNSLFWLCLLIVGIPLFPFYVLVIVSFISLISFLLKCSLDGNYKFLKEYVDWLVLCFIICIVGSSLLSINGNLLTKSIIINLLFISNYFVAANSIKNMDDINIIINYFLVIGMIVCFYGLYQYFFGNLSISVGSVDPSLFSNITKRMMSTFDNPIFLGEFLIIYSSICFGSMLNSIGFKKIVLFILFGISVCCLLLTYSRGCFLGLMGALVLMMIVLDKKNILFFLLLLLIAFLVMPENIVERIFSIGNLAESSNSYRLATWRGTLSILYDFWFSGVGYGVDNYVRLFTYYSYTYFYINVEHAHNVILSLFSGLGIFGVLSFVGMLLFYFKRCISCYIKININENRSVKKVRVVLLSIMCSIFGILIVGMFDHILHKYSIMLLFFILIGLCIGVVRVLEVYNEE